LKLKESLLWWWLRIPLLHFLLPLMEVMIMGMRRKLVKGRMAWRLIGVMQQGMPLLIPLR
jgi:hypothetical protein